MTISLWGCGGGAGVTVRVEGCVLCSGKFGYVRLLDLITLQHMQIAKHLVLHKHMRLCNQMTVWETVGGGYAATELLTQKWLMGC